MSDREKSFVYAWMSGFFAGLLISAIVLFLASLARGQTPQSEVVAARNDCEKLDPATARQTRYLTMYNWTPKERAAFLTLMSVQINHLSREGELVAARLVSPSLLALCCDDYGWELTTYGSLHEGEPYFHVKIRQGKEETTAHAPWLPTKEIAELSKMTGSIVPLLRADWFLWQTSHPQTYYKFIGIEKLADLEKMVGLDRKLIEEKRKDLAAVVAKSTVTVNPRAIFRLQSSMGAWWESRDVANPTGKGNPLRNLDKDYEPEAFEIFATGPNGLFYKALANKNKLLGEAPPDVASDSTSRTPNHQVVCPRCDICHAGQLRAPVDYFRQKLGGAFGVTIGVTYDRDKAKRHRGLYFGPLYEELASDNLKQAAALKRLGTTPAEYSKAYADAFYGYETGLTQESAAKEFGLPWVTMARAIVEYVNRVGVSDLGLAPYMPIQFRFFGCVMLLPSSELIPRSHHQEMFALLSGILYNPPKGVKP